MLSLIINVIVVCMVVGLLLWAIANLPFIPAPMGQILKVVIIVIACIWLITTLLEHTGSLGLGHGVAVGVR